MVRGGVDGRRCFNKGVYWWGVGGRGVGGECVRAKQMRPRACMRVRLAGRAGPRAIIPCQPGPSLQPAAGRPALTRARRSRHCAERCRPESAAAGSLGRERICGDRWPTYPLPVNRRLQTGLYMGLHRGYIGRTCAWGYIGDT